MKDTVTMSGTPRWISTPVTLHAVQCARCLKWRIIPTKEQYEAIREHILEKPWVCESASNWRSELHCDLPADIQQDRSMLWAIDKPNLPSAPAGWERQITVRTDGSSKFADVYIAKYPDSVPPNTTLDQFSFAIPRPLPGLCPQLTQARGKLAISQVPHEKQDEQGQATPLSADNILQENDEEAGPNPAQVLSSEQRIEYSDARQLPNASQNAPLLLEQSPQPSKRQNPDLTLPSRQTKKQQVIKKD